MTKVIDLKNGYTAKIKFTKHFDRNQFVDTTGKPNEWNEVYRLPFKVNGLDAFACMGTPDNPKEGNLFLGDFNDGIV